VKLPAKHVPVNHTPSKMSTWSLCSSYSRRVKKFKLPEVRCPDEVGKTDDPNYYLYHRMLGRLTKNYCIFKDVLQALIDVDVLRLRPEQKMVMANMMSLKLGIELPSVPTGVVSILKGELRVINTDPPNKKEKGLVPIMWVHPDFIESQQWTTVTYRKSKDKAKASSSNVMGISTRETEKDVASLTSSGEE